MKRMILFLCLAAMLIQLTACGEKKENPNEPDAKEIWQQLVDAGTVDEKSQVLSLKQNEDRLELDVNTAFGEQLRSYGTAGEYELMKQVVNTYLDAYECEEIKITEEGGVLYSGHAEYDGYQKRYE